MPSINGKGLVVTAADFAASLSAPKVPRRADGSPDMNAFRLATESKPINSGAIPAGEIPFEAAKYYVGAPDLGAVEAGTTSTGLIRAQGMPSWNDGHGLRGSAWLAPERVPGVGRRNAAGRFVPAVRP